MPEFGLSDMTLAQVRGILASCPLVEKAVVFGSRAKGTHRPGSDIDLTLIGSQLTPDMLSKLSGIFDASSLPYQVDLSIQSHIDNPQLLAHIARVGRVLYERGIAAGANE